MDEITTILQHNGKDKKVEELSFIRTNSRTYSHKYV
jgi:hypothetical protein